MTGSRGSWSALAAPLAVAGCLLATVTGAVEGRRADERELLRELDRRGVDRGEVVLPHALDAHIEAWLAASIPQGLDEDARLERLLELLLDRNELDLEYHQGYTGTAVEAFESRRANCLAFTHLFVGMARQIGADVYYLKVDDLQSFEREGDLVVVSGHVTAGFGPRERPKVLEFTVFPVTEYRRFRALSDLSAVALFYSNRGAELLLDGDLAAARGWLETAVEIDPFLPDAWVNLGVVRRRSGEPAAAEIAYRRALEIDPDFVSAYQNLASLLLRDPARSEEGRRLLALTEVRANRNPFNYLALGDLSLAQGRMDDSERYYRRALALDSDHPECLAAMGEWHLAQGREGKARKWLRRARRIDPEAPRVQRLERRLAGQAERKP